MSTNQSANRVLENEVKRGSRAVEPKAVDGHGGISAMEMEALEWQVRLWSGETEPGAAHEFQQWLSAGVEQQAAWQRVQQIGEQLQAVPAGVAGSALRSTLSARAQRGRRSLLRGFLLVAAGGVTAYAARQTPQWSRLAADYRTPRGERRDVMLPDGTHLVLNTASAVDLRFDEQERRLLLHAGEILVTTAPDSAADYRPFVVQTREGTVKALGTRFLVRSLDEIAPPQVAVQVLEAAVEVMPLYGEAPRRVAAGEQVRFTRHAVDAPTRADPQAAAWRDGLLVAERMRLGDFLAELARYRPGVIRCDPAVAHLVVSGVYPLQDTDLILASLPAALPVSVSMTTRYWVTVTK